MKQAAILFVVAVCLLSPSPHTKAQTQTQTQIAPAKAPSAKPAVNQTLPPFSGIWLLNLDRSKIEGSRVPGISQAVIEYDGKSWHYIHSHMENALQLPDTWQITMTVGSPVFRIVREEPLTYRSRIYRDGSALVLLTYIRSDKGQRVKNTTRYTLEDGTDTLVELEKSVGPIGTITNRWVLERQSAGITIHAP